MSVIIEMTNFSHKRIRCGKKADLERNNEHYCFRCNDQIWHGFKGVKIGFRFGKIIDFGNERGAKDGRKE